MTERREPTISARSDHDDPLASRVAPAAMRTAAPPPARVVSSSPLAPFAVLLSLASLALGGFFYWQLTQFQAVVQQAGVNQVASDLRITELEKMLSATGETSQESLAAIQATTSKQAQDLLKLRAEVTEAKAKLAAGLEDINSGLSAKIQGALKENEGKTKASIAEVQSEVKVLQDLVEAQQSSAGRDDEARKEQSAKIAELGKRFKSLEADLGERVRNNENAIESIDAFRLQVNREILKLKGGEQ